MKMEFLPSPRPSPIAGTWYPGDPVVLRSEIDGYIQAAKLSDDEFSGNVFGIVSPHAGYQYSGRTAGYAYRMLQGLKRDIVVILSPFHPYHSADLLTTAHRKYKTPLGEVPVAKDILKQLAKGFSDNGLVFEQVKNDKEHSLEIQLPFTQCALDGDFSVLPMMVRTREPEKVKEIADALHTTLRGTSFVVIASTDLSHFYPLETAQELDGEMLRRIKSMDAERVLSAETEGTASACGASSVAALLYMARSYPSSKAYILNYSTSAEETGDNTSVVGYGSAAILK